MTTPARRPSNLFFPWGFILLVGCCALGGWLAAGAVNRQAPAARAHGNASVPPAPALSRGADAGPAGQGKAGPDMPAVGGALPVVCIDPGHPSEVNRAATVQNGLREVEVVYDIALRLRQNLEDPEHPIARVVMTRNFRGGTGGIVTNRKRAEIANAAGATLFLRLHCDTGTGAGYTIYYPDRTGTAPDGSTGPAPPVIARSGAAARVFHAGMVEVMHDATLALQDNGVKGDSATYIGRRQGVLTGSVYAEVPTLTVEMVFLSNPHDAGIIGSDDGQQLMADALTFGVLRVLEAAERRR